jgi:hypothetical protein
VSEIDGDFEFGGTNDHHSDVVDVDASTKEKRKMEKDLHAQATARSRALALAAEAESDARESNSFMSNIFSSKARRERGGTRSSFVGSGMNPLALAMKKPSKQPTFLEEDVHPPWVVPEKKVAAVNPPAEIEVKTAAQSLFPTVNASPTNAAAVTHKSVLESLNEDDDVESDHRTSTHAMPFQSFTNRIDNDDDGVKAVEVDTRTPQEIAVANAFRDSNDLNDVNIDGDDGDVNNSIQFTTGDVLPSKRDEINTKKVFARKNPLTKARLLPTRK